MSLQDKVVLVTGGTGALGQAITKHFVDGGARVHVPWIVEKEVEYLKKHLGGGFVRVTLHAADVTDETAVMELRGRIEEQEGRLEVLANIVGGFAFAALEDTTLTSSGLYADPVPVAGSFIADLTTPGPAMLRTAPLPPRRVWPPQTEKAPLVRLLRWLRGR